MQTGDLLQIDITGGRVRRGMIASFVEETPEGLVRIELPNNLGRVIIKKENIKTVADIEETRKSRSLTSLKRVEPEDVPPADLVYLNSVKSSVTVRFSWPPFMDSAVHERFKELGKELPEDARPMNSGARGGKPMYSLSCEVKVDGKEYFSKVSYGLTLYIREGFDITYAKRQN
jgi:hypothetical protein